MPMVFRSRSSSLAFWYHSGAWKTVKIAERGKMGQATSQTTSTVILSTTSPVIFWWKLKPPPMAGSPFKSRLNLTASASQTSPLWKVTPSRRVKRQVSGACWAQLSTPLSGTTSKLALSIQVKGSVAISSQIIEGTLPLQPSLKVPREVGSSWVTR